MDFSTLPPLAPAAAVPSDAIAAHQDNTSLVDPFLVEALQNPRHRLTILRMELDIKKFLQNPYQEQFVFQHFPTSYLRLAAHRVAQHYSLQTVVQDNFVDCQGTRIVVRKSGEIRYPAVSLSDIPAKHLEDEKQEKVKIVTRPRPGKDSSNESSLLGIKRSPLRTMEERMEEYDKARARIFNSPSGCSVLEDMLSKVPSDEKSVCSSGDENEGFVKCTTYSEKNFGSRDAGTSSRVAIFRDKEKDRTDPDYDRSYEKYVRNMTTAQGFSLSPYGMQNFQHPCVQYNSVFPQLGQMLSTQASRNYNSNVGAFCAFRLNQPSTDAIYMQWPSPAMMYAESYDQFRNAFSQAPFCQQPLSSNYSQQPLSSNYSQSHY